MATLTFKPALRDRLFYDQYQYSLQFHLAGAGNCRNPATIDEAVQWRNTNLRSRFGWAFIDDAQRGWLHDWVNLSETLSENKVVYCTNHVYVYSNSAEDLETIAQQPYAKSLYATETVINRPRDTILLKDPKHKFRTFFKDRFMEKTQAETLRKFLLSRTDCFRYTPNLKYMLSREKSFYTLSHYFVDHNDMKDVVMLQIVCPGVVRKTLTIQAK